MCSSVNPSGVCAVIRANMVLRPTFWSLVGVCTFVCVWVCVWEISCRLLMHTCVCVCVCPLVCPAPAASCRAEVSLTRTGAAQSSPIWLEAPLPASVSPELCHSQAIIETRLPLLPCCSRPQLCFFVVVFFFKPSSHPPTLYWCHQVLLLTGRNICNWLSFHFWEFAHLLSHIQWWRVNEISLQCLLKNK